VCARVIHLAETLIRRAQLCQGCAASAPLASWDSAHLELDGRIAAGDPVAMFDVLVEAIWELGEIRDEVDRDIVVDAGPLVGGRGTLARLAELRERAAGGFALFAQGDGGLGVQPEGAAEERR